MCLSSKSDVIVIQYVISYTGLCYKSTRMCKLLRLNHFFSVSIYLTASYCLLIQLPCQKLKLNVNALKCRQGPNSALTCHLVSARLQYLHCVSSGDTAVLYKAKLL